MSNTEFFSPNSLSEALNLLAQYKQGAIIVNGGTDIVEKIANKAVDPEAIIYIQGIQELKGIREEGGYVYIGGTATYNDVMASPLCRQFSGLQQAVREVGSPPIRVVGTPAGNTGTAVPAADCNVALMALKAEFVLASASGERIIQAKDMYVGYCRTKLEPGELIKEIRIPSLDSKTGSAFVKIAKRKAQDIAQVSVGVSLTVEGDRCKDICIAMGAVGPTTIRAYSIEEILIGKPVAEGVALAKATIPSEVVLRSPRNKPYKEAIIGVMVERAVKKAYAEILEGRN